MAAAAGAAAGAAAVVAARNSNRRWGGDSREVYICSPAGDAIRTEQQLLQVTRGGLMLVASGICSWGEFDLGDERRFPDGCSNKKDFPTEVVDIARMCAKRYYESDYSGYGEYLRQKESMWTKKNREDFAQILFAIQILPLSPIQLEIFTGHPNYLLKKFIIDSQRSLNAITEGEADRLGDEWLASAQYPRHESPPWLHSSLLFAPEGTLERSQELCAEYKTGGRVSRFLRDKARSELQDLCSSISRGKQWVEVMPFSCLEPRYLMLIPYWSGIELKPIWYNLIEVIESESKLSSNEIRALLQHPHAMVREAVKEKYPDT